MIEKQKSKIRLTPGANHLSGISGSIDTVREQRVQDANSLNMNWDVLMEARSCWDSLATMRENRARCYRYVYGDQWSDEVKLTNGCCTTEREQIADDGNVPLTNNLIRSHVVSVLGVYRNQNKKPGVSANDRREQKLSDLMNVLLDTNWRNNYKKEIDVRCFEDFLIGGVAAEKETYGWNREAQKNDAWSYVPDVNRMFWNPDACDARMWDTSIVGEIHDLDFTELCGTFVHSPGDVTKLRAIYSHCRDVEHFKNWYGQWAAQREDYHKLENLDFFVPSQWQMCRVIEIWRKEAKPRYHVWDTENGGFWKCEIKDKAYYDEINRQRVLDYVAQGYSEDDVPKIELEWFVDEYWYYRFLSPLGDVLDEGETPYDHKSHPYSLKLYPLNNGDIHSFVGDLIDQQRYINRMISLNDKLIRSAAKGVLMYPMSLIPDGMTPEDIERDWKKPDALLFVDDLKGRMSGMKPEQYVNKLVNIGTTEMIQMQMSLMEDISGVHGALQGKPGFAGQSATLYAQQTQNASIRILDYLESFGDLILRASEKKVSNINQFYDPERVLLIAGDMNILPEELTYWGDTQFDLVISEMADTPLERSRINEMLMTMFQLGAINIKQLLKFGNWPFSDALLESVEADEQAAMEQQAMAQQQGQQMPAPQMGNTQQALQGMTPEGVDGEAVEQAQRLMRYDILSPHDAQVRVREQAKKDAGVS
jgi:hypothetical protein